MEKTNENQKNIWWKNPTLWLSVLFFVLVAIDQLIKIWADSYFSKGNDDIIIIPGVIELCIEYNRGIAFSSFANAGMAWKLIIVIGTCLLMIGLSFLFFKIDSRRALLRLALVFIVAGGVGNLIDRILYRVWDPSSISTTGESDGVRDMVRLHIIFNFGVCNFADFFIVAGAVMLALSMLFFDAEAVFPATAKYKALAKEYEEKAEKKKAEKLAQAQAQTKQSPPSNDEDGANNG
ncbi:MAG: signal peptidase II [Clostridiales bacterium]|nr:signal peptidase II [Clostridiales bacterium]